MIRQRVLSGAILLALLAVPATALAQDGLTVEASAAAACGTASFEVAAAGGIGPYTVAWDFGDGEAETADGVETFPQATEHPYTSAGEFAWTVMVSDSSDPALEAGAGGTIVIGPQVTLTSDPFPPLVTLTEGEATVNFSAAVTGGEAPYTYAWDLDGDGVFEPGAETASHAYTAGGKYTAAVQVTDNCGLTTTASLHVVVIDPEAEACHPMAQRIADGVSSLFPDQSTQLYTCEDIFGFFQGALTGNTLGFGRMWHAYRLATTMEELTWEEILQWQLDGSGWGLLVQLDRFGETLSDVGLRELFDMVVSGEATVGDIRTAVRATTRFEADFYDALERIQAGANPGELTQLYRAAADLGLDPSEVDAFLAEGLSLAELRHAGRLAEQSGGDLDLLADAHAAGASWGEIKQAIALGGEGGDLTAILEAGVRETRQQERDQLREQRLEEQNQARQERQAEQGARLAARLALRYGITIEQVQALADGACAGDWNCVQTTLREMYAPERGGGRGGKK